jgi:hypothetical protein
MVRVEITDPDVFGPIRPEALPRYLGANGWREVRHIEGELVVLQKGTQLVWMPISDQFTDYAPMIARLVKTVAETEEKSQLQILDDLQTVAVGDVIRVGTFNPLDAHDQTIPLNDGISLLAQAKAMAVAGASSEVDKKPVHPSQPVFEVRKFTQELRLAQTERGSFLIRLVVPIEPKQKSGELELMPDQLPFARRAVLQLMKGLRALKDAAEDNKRRGKFAFPSFSEAVPFGVSANLCEAILPAEEKKATPPIEVSITWSYALPSQDNLSTKPITFEPAIVPFIRQAATEFRTRHPEIRTVQGWVNVLKLDKPSAVGGEIHIMTIVDGAPRSVRVRLQKEDYDKALDAQKSGYSLRVTGTLIKEGMIYRLNSPSDVRIVRQLDMFESGE